MIAPVALIFLAVLFGGHWYLASRLILDCQLPPRLTAMLLWGIGLLCAALIAQPISERLLARAKVQWLAWIASVWMGFAFLFLLLLLAYDTSTGSAAATCNPKIATIRFVADRERSEFRAEPSPRRGFHWFKTSATAALEIV